VSSLMPFVVKRTCPTMLCGGDPAIGRSWGETFEKRSFLFKFKEGENFNHMNTLSISRIKI
jgi:hypothetical protein